MHISMCIVKSRQDKRTNSATKRYEGFFFFKVLFNLAPQLLPPMESLENHSEPFKEKRTMSILNSHLSIVLCGINIKILFIISVVHIFSFQKASIFSSWPMIYNREMLWSNKMYTIICILESREVKKNFQTWSELCSYPCLSNSGITPLCLLVWCL